MTAMEYREVKIPDEIMKKLEDAAGEGKPMTLGEAGVFDWLNKLSASEGWRAVWQGFNFPYIILEREKPRS